MNKDKLKISRCAVSQLGWYVILCLALLLAACASPPVAPSKGHLQSPPPSPVASDIPKPVRPLPLHGVPQREEEDLLTVVVNDVSLKELLFALARDSGRNIDIDPGIDGRVTLNAIDQSLIQILDRLVSQAGIRYHRDGDLIRVEQDLPYIKQYNIDYLNMQREAKSTVTIKTEISSTGGGGEGGGGGAGGGNLSSTDIQNQTANDLWATLLDNVAAILRGGDSLGNKAGKEGPAEGGDSGAGSSAGSQTSIIANRESGILTVRATARQHAQIQQYVDKALNHALRQVLIEATVVEVTLNDDYQAGVDWSKLATGSGLALTQSMLGGSLGTAPFFALSLTGSHQGNPLTATVRLLNQFGDSRVLSSPKLMVLNNQTALLKVVDNHVYFTTSVETDTTQGVSTTTVSTEVHTVPVGFVMSVMPQISENKVVTLNARPTLSRIVGFVDDPNPALAAAGVTSRIPEVQVREIESVLKIASGNIGVIGGLMQDTASHDTSGVPGVSRVKGLGDLFSFKQNKYQKTELVIFLRPVVIQEASINSDLKAYRPYLDASTLVNTGGRLQ